MFGISVFVNALPAKAVLEGDPELLRMTVMAQKNNVERIATWQGYSNVEDIREDSKGIMIREESAYSFVYSREHEATRWEWKGQNRYVREGLVIGGVTVMEDWDTDWANEMRKGDAFYKYDLARTTKEGKKLGALAITSSNKAEVGVYSYSFDPMWYLKGRATVGVDDLAEMLMVFDCYRENLSVPMTSLTPTNYPVDQSSVYSTEYC